MASNTPEVPEGRSYVLFKRKGARAFSAAIKLHDGHTEVLETKSTLPNAAVLKTNARLRKLYRERGLTSPTAAKLGGAPSAYQIRKRQELGLPITATLKELRAAQRGEAPKNGVTPSEPPKKLGRPPGTKNGEPRKIDGRRKNVAITDEMWDEHTKEQEVQNTLRMQQIATFLLLGMPAEEFQQTCRAIVVRSMQKGGR